MSDFEKTVLKALSDLQLGQKSLAKDVRRVEVLQEEMSGKIDHIIEAVSPEFEKTNTHAVMIENLDTRLTLVEKIQRAAV